jgi:DNA-binding IclR family transcriptional regulator
LLTRSQLDRSLATTRRLGFGYIAGTDAISVSLAVDDGDGQAVAALTCAGPSKRLTRPRLAEVVETLRAVAESASRAHPAAESQLIEQRRTG